MDKLFDFAQLPFNPYQLLQVTPDAAPQALTAGYRRLLGECYDPEGKPSGDARLPQLLWAAYHLLIDEDSRRAYDRFLTEGRHGDGL